MFLKVSGISAYVKPITPVYGSDTSFALGFLNRNNGTNVVEFVLRNLGLTNPRGYVVKDLWRARTVTKVGPDDRLRFDVPGTGAAMFRAELVKPNRWLESNRVLQMLNNRIPSDF
ncbi:unnamed protein product [Heligmosomoides polygyrus]|uniref:Melibiase_C domain-containing protein n=1 Tax=Heligmosomoides polygyrus TaxID=6339 RepID=A0A183G0Z2_HELPZ|nr:unnamed protein product [Heligmosomoides polygyrus]